VFLQKHSANQDFAECNTRQTFGAIFWRAARKVAGNVNFAECFSKNTRQIKNFAECKKKDTRQITVPARRR
jgi:hypothetical protein